MRQFVVGLLFMVFAGVSIAEENTNTGAEIDHRLGAILRVLTSQDPSQLKSEIQYLEANWQPDLIAPMLEALNFARTDLQTELINYLLTKKTGQRFQGTNDWYFWLWNQDFKTSANYANFKAALYGGIDRRFARYFVGRGDQARIRLDEVRWGGVVQDGIPPLRDPEMISAEEATYLQPDNIVFGISINGDARAYPKRILAWHEMFVDEIGGVEIAGVYCTLCGAVIPYRTKVGDKTFALGTSGFLYRSNKLMYDQATQSLWSTNRGVPVIGPLVDKGIQLEQESVVTTTWAEWKRRHPKTTVLSLNTGHQRDYGEGVAYNDYFSSDRLMFNTPFKDQRLKNKREILGLRFPAAPNQQLAIDAAFLSENPIYKSKIGLQQFVVVTDQTGANRVFDTKGVEFKDYDGDRGLKDDAGVAWILSEDQLLAADGRTLSRLPAHRAFWFGWQAAFPETQLVK